METQSPESLIVAEILRHNDVVISSQQIGDPEPTVEEKRKILSDFLTEKKSSTFLARFGKFLTDDQLQFFRGRDSGDQDESYCIDYHIGQLTKSTTTSKSTVRNRRFAALQKLIDGKDEYFSEQEMMRREPTLYEEMVGQHLTPEETQSRDRCENPTFLSALLRGIEMEQLRDHRESLRERAVQEDEAAISEESQDEDEEEEKPSSSSLWGEFDDAPQRPATTKKRNTSRSGKPTDPEKAELRMEFVEIMYQKFLNGDDKDFDYESVDRNADFDDLEMVEQDEQDKYFDDSDSLSDDFRK